MVQFLFALAVLCHFGILAPHACRAFEAPAAKRGLLQANQELKGKIVWTDRRSRAVWINLGQAQGLKPRDTFQVMEQTDDEAVKGKIEVTRLLGPHLAEARILDEKADNPLVKDDLVTP